VVASTPIRMMEDFLDWPGFVFHLTEFVFIFYRYIIAGIMQKTIKEHMNHDPREDETILLTMDALGFTFICVFFGPL